MNEKIQSLAEQAGFENGHQDRNGNSLSYELEKFAELIVQECGKVAYEETVHFPKPCDWLLDKFKRHFGVE